MKYAVEWNHGEASLPHKYISDEDKPLAEVLNMVIMTSSYPAKLRFIQIARPHVKHYLTVTKKDVDLTFLNYEYEKQT